MRRESILELGEAGLHQLVRTQLEGLCFGSVAHDEYRISECFFTKTWKVVLVVFGLAAVATARPTGVRCPRLSGAQLWI